MLFVLASETCALDLISAKYVRDIEPGEIVIIDKDGLRSIQAFPDQTQRAFCIFEYVYFARPDSTIANRNVYKVRVEMGRELAREHKIDADIVIPVPDSGNCAALGYSLESGIPFEMAFVRNHYVGRSFLQPSQLIRDFDVRVKLNLISDLVRGKRVIVVDDSIVRGTTCKARVNNLKEKPALKEVHVLVSCPPHMNPCVYGIDFPDRSKLMSANHSFDEIRAYLSTPIRSRIFRRTEWSAQPDCRAITSAWPVTTANIRWHTILPAVEQVMEQRSLPNRGPRVRGINKEQMQTEVTVSIPRPGRQFWVVSVSPACRRSSNVPPLERRSFVGKPSWRREGYENRISTFWRCGRAARRVV